MPIKYLFILVLIFAFVLGCNNSSHDNNKGEDVSTGVSLKCPKKIETKLTKANVQGVNFFMEVSGSMKYFMPASSISTDFQILVPDLLARLNTDLPKVKFFALAQANSPIKEIDINTVKSQIAYGKFSFGSSSILPVMFDSVIAKLRPDALSVLLTDAIYSPTSDKSRTKAQLIADIRSVITKATLQGYAVSCFSFKSQFKTIESPYYYFVFGTPQNVLAFREKLLNSMNAENANIKSKVFNEINFGNSDLLPFYSIIPYAENTGAGEPVECPEWDNRYLAMENVRIKSGPKFWIGLDLSKCPSYAQQPDYIKSNLTISNNGLNARMAGNVISKSEFSSKVEDETDKGLYNKCTHFIRIELLEIADKSGDITISFQKSDPAWIKEYSHDRDNESETFREKTYGLNNIIGGIKDAYKDKESGFFFMGLKILITK